MWLSSASEIYADLDWEATMGGNSWFASLFVIGQWPLFGWLHVYTGCHGTLGWGLP